MSHGKYTIKWTLDVRDLDVSPDYTPTVFNGSVLHAPLMTLDQAREILWAEAKDTALRSDAKKEHELIGMIVKARCLCAEVGQRVRYGGADHWIEEVPDAEV